MRLIVADIAVAEDVLGLGEVQFIQKRGQIVVGGADAMGATIVFEQSGKPGR
jgi:hypothetical protein